MGLGEGSQEILRLNIANNVISMDIPSHVPGRKLSVKRAKTCQSSSLVEGLAQESLQTVYG